METSTGVRVPSPAMEHSQLELVMPLGALQRALQRSVDLVAFGLQAAERATVTQLAIPGLFNQVSPARNERLGVDSARSLFQNWVIANGLRDCVEAVSPALEWARKFCFMWTGPGKAVPLENGQFRLEATFSAQDWNDHIVRGAQRFDRLPLPQKFEHLNVTYGWAIPTLADHVLSLNGARNCLAHRGGIVAAADLKNQSDSALTVRLRRLQVMVSGPEGQRSVSQGTVVNSGESVTAAFVDWEKSVALGQRIEFTPEEYVDAALTFLLFGMEVQTSSEAIQNARMPSQDK